MSMKTLLEVEIEEKFEKLAKLDPTTKEYATAVEGVTKLMDRALEIEKFESAEANSEKQIKEDRKSRIVKNIIDVGTTLVPLGVSVWMALVSLKFEETGSITTTIGRKTLDRLFKR